MLNTTETNFKAEVLATALTESGIEAEKILLVRQKGDKKDVSKDIHKVERRHSGFDMQEYLYIFTNRESIYDSMPEGLFHQASSSGKHTSKEDIVREIKAERNRENDARKLFRPFEMALDGILAEAQFKELKYDRIHLYDNLTDILRDDWKILQYLPTRRALLFLHVIPLLADAPRNLTLTATIISVLLDCPVNIREYRWSKIVQGTESRVKLTDWKLGINSVLGDSAGYASKDLEIGIGPVDLEKMRLFEEGQSNDLILKALVGLLMTFDKTTNIIYRTVESETRFRLSDERHTAYLGINTTL